MIFLESRKNYKEFIMGKSFYTYNEFPMEFVRKGVLQGFVNDFTRLHNIAKESVHQIAGGISTS